MTIRTPGSPTAIKAGCTCNPRTNQHGQGVGGISGVWDVAHDCALHRRQETVRANHFGVVAGAEDGTDIRDREDMKGDF